MGTMISFDVRSTGVDLAPAIELLHEADRRFSTFRADSEVNRIDRRELSVADAHPDVREVLEIGVAAERAGCGAFTLTPGGHLDPSAVVKGWAVQRASDMLLAGGSQAHLINAGGDIATVGGRTTGEPWRIAIGHPWSPNRVVCVVSAPGISVATSGITQRGAHVVDGRSSTAALDLASITVVGRRGLTTVDIRATTALAMGRDGLAWVEQYDDSAALAVASDGSVRWSRRWPDYAIAGAGAA